MAVGICSCSIFTNLDDLRGNVPDAADGGDAASGTPTFVQQTATDFGRTDAGVVSFAFMDVAAHDTIVVCVDYDSEMSSYGVLSVTDSAGDAFHLDVGPIDTGLRHYIFSANDVAGGSPSLQLTISGPQPTGVLAVYLLEYSGVGAFVTGNTALGTSAVMSSGTRQVMQAGSLVLGFMDDDNVPVSADPTFNLRSTFEQQVIEDEIATAPGMYAATATTDAGSNWAALMAVFSP